MRFKAILNPCSDTGRGKQQKEIIENTGAGLDDFQVEVTQNRGEAIVIAKNAADDGFDVVIAAGGDGTVHEVINGLLQSVNRQTSLGVIPIGSGNDFAYAHGIPVDIQSAAKLIFAGQTKLIDLAKVVDDRGNTVFFANNFGIGFDANVVIRTEEITRLHGFPKYFWGVLKTLALDFRSFELKMRFDHEEVDEEILFIAFGLGKRHGGGFMLTPEALNDDDLTDSCTVRKMSRLKALRFLNSAVQGTHINNPLVTMRQSKHVEIQSNQPLPLHADGEVYAHPRDNVRSLIVTSFPAELKLIA